jgi:hypothetical protein
MEVVANLNSDDGDIVLPSRIKINSVFDDAVYSFEGTS